MNTTRARRSLAAAVWGVAGLMLPGLVVLEAVSARNASARERLEVVAAHAQLRRTLAAELTGTELARRADAATLLVASIGDDRLIGGIALDPPVDARIGCVWVGADSELLPDGIYEMRVASSGAAADLVDESGRTVVTVPLDLPFDGASDPGGRWQRTFFTVARWLAPRLGGT